MPRAVLLQMWVLLVISQLLLGAVGLAITMTGWPVWLGLPLTVLLIWIVVRLGRILREEAERLRAPGQVPARPWLLPTAVALCWQLPGLLLLVLPLPMLYLMLWHGAVLPLFAPFAGTRTMAEAIAGFALASVAQGGLLVWAGTARMRSQNITAAPSASASRTPAAPAADDAQGQPRAAGGTEWYAVRRVKDVQSRRGRRVR